RAGGGNRKNPRADFEAGSGHRKNPCGDLEAPDAAEAAPSDWFNLARVEAVGARACLRRRVGSAQRRRDASTKDLMQHLQHAGVDQPVLDFNQIRLQLGQYRPQLHWIMIFLFQVLFDLAEAALEALTIDAGGHEIVAALACLLDDGTDLLSADLDALGFRVLWSLTSGHGARRLSLE